MPSQIVQINHDFNQHESNEKSITQHNVKLNFTTLLQLHVIYLSSLISLISGNLNVFLALFFFFSFKNSLQFTRLGQQEGRV